MTYASLKFNSENPYSVSSFKLEENHRFSKLESKYFNDPEKRDDYLFSFMNSDYISKYRFYFDNGKRYDQIILFDDDDYDIAAIYVEKEKQKEFEEKYRTEISLPWKPRDINTIKQLIIRNNIEEPKENKEKSFHATRKQEELIRNKTSNEYTDNDGNQTTNPKKIVSSIKKRRSLAKIKKSFQPKITIEKSSDSDDIQIHNPKNQNEEKTSISKESPFKRQADVIRSKRPAQLSELNDNKVPNQPDQIISSKRTNTATKTSANSTMKPSTTKNQSRSKSVMPKSKIISKSDKVIITRYLRTYLIFNDSAVKRFIISNKSSNEHLFGHFLDQICVAKKILSYSIIQKDSEYVIEYFNRNTPVKDLPSYLNIQIRPHISYKYVIVVICNKSQMYQQIDMNEYHYSFAVVHKNGLDELKANIMKYLSSSEQLSISEKPTFFQFQKNYYKLVIKDDDLDDNAPLFTYWREEVFEKIVNCIKSKMMIFRLKP